MELFLAFLNRTYNKYAMEFSCVKVQKHVCHTEIFRADSSQPEKDGVPLQGDSDRIPLAQAGVVYYSEEMMAFIRDLQDAFGSPPRYLRQAFKRSEDFWHKRIHKSSGGPKLSLGELFSFFNMNIHGVDCAMQHHVVTSGDLGEVHARPEDCKCVSVLVTCLPLISCRILRAARAPSCFLSSATDRMQAMVFKFSCILSASFTFGSQVFQGVLCCILQCGVPLDLYSILPTHSGRTCWLC